MPYHLKRKGELYFVVDESGKKYSHKGLSKETARKQMIALNIAHAKKMGYIDSDLNLKAPECDQTCNTQRIKGNLVVFNDSLAKLFMPPVLSVKSEPVAVQAPKMMPPRELKMETVETSIAPKTARNVVIEPKKVGRPLKVITEDLAIALASDEKGIREMAIMNMNNREWERLNNKRRKIVYNTIRATDIDVPTFIMTSYKRWLKKQDGSS